MASEVQTRLRGHRLSQHSRPFLSGAQAAASAATTIDQPSQRARVVGRLSAPSCGSSKPIVATGINNLNSNPSIATAAALAAAPPTWRPKHFEEFEVLRARESTDSDTSDYGELDSPAEVGKESQQQQPDDRHHSVGPVMGIFFKVWSLVKVTRGRHQQRMRRQNSEETGRFQYLSGDQYAQQQQQQQQQLQSTTAAATLLEDRHFRRAGSQPAPSCRAPLESLLVGGRPAAQPAALEGVAGNPQRLTLAATGTNSTSSGFSSSSTSSTLANSSPPPPPAQQQQPSNNWSSGAAKRASLRRPVVASNQLAAVPSSAALPPAGAANQSKSTGSSWTSKIRRSATSVSPGDLSSYTSRFRFTSQRTGNSGGNSNQKRQQQEQQQQQQQQQQQRQLKLQLMSKSESINLNQQQQVQVQRRQVFQGGSNSSGANSNSEDDSNEIYSTPNDSIQSVPFNMAPTFPSGANNSSSASGEMNPVMAGAAGVADPRACSPASSHAHLAGHAQIATAYPIIKSFSTTNFSQLLIQQQQQQHQLQQFAPIDELGVPACRISDLPRQDSSQSAASATSNHNQSKRLSGSRFFISSSSSEDSNSPNQQQQQQQGQQGQQQLATGAPRGRPLELEHRQLALGQSVHLHAPARQFATAASRPDSLVVGGQTAVAAAASNLQSPLDCIVLPSRPTSILLANRPKNFSASVALETNGTQAAGSYLRSIHQQHQYRKSPSLFEISCQQQQAPAAAPSSRLTSRFSSKYPVQAANFSSAASALIRPTSMMNPSLSMSSFRPPPVQARVPPAEVAPSGEHQTNLAANQGNNGQAQIGKTTGSFHRLSNSISLHDCKPSSCQPNHQPTTPFSKQPEEEAAGEEVEVEEQVMQDEDDEQTASSKSSEAEYKLAQMLLEFGSNPNARDASSGCTVLMQAILSDNLPTIKCLIERGVDLNAINSAGTSALDLACSRAPTKVRLEILKLLIDNRANLDRTRESDGSRLLDRLIAEHRELSPVAPPHPFGGGGGGGNISPTALQLPLATPSDCSPNKSTGGGRSNKLPFIDCLLQNGAKLGSATWAAALGKHKIQLRLLKKLCQDGYFLYKQSSIEAAVFRFEYALKRLAELEQQLAQQSQRLQQHHCWTTDSQLTSIAARQIKYQTYLGLSRCERKRRFYRRALEFAHLAILVDSTAYEGYYSKAHILKDLGEVDDALLAIDQTWRLVDKSIESLQLELNNLQQQEEQLIYDGCFNLLLDSRRSTWIQSTRLELNENLEYLREARKFVDQLKGEILNDKLSSRRPNNSALLTTTRSRQQLEAIQCDTEQNNLGQQQQQSNEANSVAESPFASLNNNQAGSAAAADCQKTVSAS